jgi:streptomycin 6-kinase
VRPDVSLLPPPWPDIPAHLALNCRKTPERAVWLAALPDTIRSLAARWSLTLGAPLEGPHVSASWVAPASLPDGTSAILKLGLPHFEADYELAGLRFWNGDPTVRLFAFENTLNAMLLERCHPGDTLHALDQAEQDTVIAGLLHRLWRVPTAPHPFRPLSTMLANWAAETRAAEHDWPDPVLVREGLRLFEELSRPTATDVLLATDLHAGNILRAQREPWLVIDPKPFIGDPAYDVTQHIFNCESRLRTNPRDVMHRLADLAGLDRDRVHLWTFAREAAEPRNWCPHSLDLARQLAP